VNDLTPHERRRLKRRNLSYYLPVLDNNSQKVIGHLVDISAVGLMMDSKIPIKVDQRYNLRLDFLEEISGKGSMQFLARCRWCRTDAIQPNLYNAGFEIVSIAPSDLEVIKRIAEKYCAR